MVMMVSSPKRLRSTAHSLNTHNFRTITVRLPIPVYEKLLAFTVRRDYKFQDFIGDIICLLDAKTPRELAEFLEPVIYEKYFHKGKITHEQ